MKTVITLGDMEAKGVVMPGWRVVAASVVGGCG
jgi:hypothetical protein